MERDSAGKLKILMAGPDRSVHGGISGVVNGLYEAGIENFVDIKYIGTMREGSKLTKLLIAVLAYIRFLMALDAADIVHINVASDMSFMRKRMFIRAAHRRGKKIVIHQHGGDLRNWVAAGGDKRRSMAAGVFGMADIIIVLAQDSADVIGWICDEDESVRRRIRIMPNAITVPDRDAAAGDDRIPHSLLFMGRICRDKGIYELAEAVGRVAHDHPDIHLTLAGIWEDSGLKSIIESKSDIISYVGWVTGEAKARCLREHDILVLPSYYEGQSVAIVEAMAYGCLVVASNIGGIPMMVSDGETGLLFTPRDADSLTEALRKALSEDFHDDHTRICEAARLMVERDYDISRYIERLIGIYTELS